ncbi:hypothetical protein QZH41_003669 [Actinostola sp. cb2023]|nr:hypothetical protein QZH41_003669 [Actinostola sp. cb2023]
MDIRAAFQMKIANSPRIKARIQDNVVRLIHEQKKPFKTKLILEAEFYKKKTSTIPYFHSETETITDATDVEEVYDLMQEDVLEKLATFQNKGSGWIFRRVVALDISLDKYIPLRGEELDLLLRKGVYPYDYMNCLSKLDETALPQKEEFFSKLNDADISDEDYQHAQNVWKVFEMNTMRDYHNLYLLSDVLLLMDTFEAFRDVCIKNYKLDPCWYYTAPGLSWDAMLKMTRIRLELLTDVDMLLMVEKGIRGGVSMITKRYAKANNKYMKEYKKEEDSVFIKYLDANNLYGWAMSEPLPTHGFKWMSASKLRCWEKYSCILEVDLEYPEELHALHDEYPLAPEHLVLSKVGKLVPTTRNRSKYVVHHHTLKLYESLGMKIAQIHRGIVFHESDWLKKYIHLNTELRTAAKNDFEKDFFKLMNNSVFGKNYGKHP